MGGNQSTNYDLKGRVVLMTLIENELNIRTAFDFIDRGAHLIIGCQNPEIAIKIMSNKMSSGKVELILLDLCDDCSVLRFANQVKSRHNRIEIIMSSFEISEHAKGFSFLFKLLFDLVRNSGDLGQVCANMLKSFSEALKNRNPRRRKEDWEYSIEYSTLILISSIRLKHLRGIEYWKFRHEQSSIPNAIKHKKTQSPNLEKMHNIGEIVNHLEDEGCHIILAALYPASIRTEQFNKVVRGGSFLKWNWFNLSRNTPSTEYQPVLYIAVGTIGDNERTKKERNFLTIFRSLIFWFRDCYNKR